MQATLTDMLVTQLPTELVAPYTAVVAAIVGLIAKPTAHHPNPDQLAAWRWAAFAILLGGTFGLVWMGKARKASGTAFPLLEVSGAVVSAAGWALALPQSPLGPYLHSTAAQTAAPLIAAFAAVVLSSVTASSLQAPRKSAPTPSRPLFSDQKRRDVYGVRTNAVVLHCPGPLRRPGSPVLASWEKAQRDFFNDPATHGCCSDLSELTVVTYNTLAVPSLLEDCAARLGLRNLIVLGRGQRDWKLDYKVTLLSEYLATHVGTDYVMALDAADTLMLECPRVILERFESAATQILFSSTAWNWPSSQEAWDFENKVGGGADPAHRHLNTGGFIGSAAFLRSCLDEIQTGLSARAAWCFARHGFDDQLAWRELHRRHWPKIKVDSQCQIFVRFDEHR